MGGEGGWEGHLTWKEKQNIGSKLCLCTNAHKIASSLNVVLFPHFTIKMSSLVDVC